MKRDMDLVRKLLIDFSEGKSKTRFTTHSYGRDTEEVLEDQRIEYHMKIMRDYGLITYKDHQYKGGFNLLKVPELTWEGQDYLSAIKSDTIWQKTKDGIKSKGLELGSVAFGTIIEYAKFKASELLGM